MMKIAPTNRAIAPSHRLFGTRCDLRKLHIKKVFPPTRLSAASQDPPPEPPTNEEEDKTPNSENAALTDQQVPGAENANQDQDLQVPQSVIAKLRDTVFGIDSLFVTSVENYGSSGVLFKGNLRGDPAAAYQKLKSRLEAQLGTTYRLFLLEDQEEKPVAVVIPASSAEFQSVNPVAETSLAILLGLTTIVTTLNINDAELFNAALLTVKFDLSLVQQAIPGTLATLAILAAHETGHIFGAKKANLELSPPIFIPAGLGLLGAFGAITRIRSPVQSRTDLATVTTPGPLAGFAISFVIFLIGLSLTAGGSGGLEVDSDSFRESLLVGSMSQLVFGDKIFTAEALNSNYLLVAGWAGMIINSINSLPAGELDGGRMFLSLFGRRAASRMSALVFFLLGIFGFNSSLSLFWLLLVLTLQRGPIVPCDEELTPLKEGSGLKIATLVALLLPALVLLPYPFAPVEMADFASSMPPPDF